MQTEFKPLRSGSDSSLIETTVLDALNWRYATQQFDPTRTIPAATWHVLEEALRLAPSAFGMQPWKFIVVTDQRVKEELVQHSFGQAKVAQNSHLLVIAAKTDYTSEDTARFMERNAEVRGVEVTSLDGFAAMINGSVAALPAAERAAWLKRQSYIPLGSFLTAAALLRVDAAPMEGFVPAEYDRVLGLEGTGYSAAVIVAAGYRQDEDKYAHLAKVRFEREELFQDI